LKQKNDLEEKTCGSSVYEGADGAYNKLVRKEEVPRCETTRIGGSARISPTHFIHAAKEAGKYE